MSFATFTALVVLKYDNVRIKCKINISNSKSQGKERLMRVTS